MFSKALSRSIVSVLGCVFVLSLCIGIPGAIANDGDDCNLYGCDNDCKFTTDFRLEDCTFETTGINPYLILEPGYQLVLESDEEKAVETVLQDTKWINLSGRKIETRVVEERAFELEDGEEKLVEISLNWFAICKETNAVYYFGEWSRDCEDGFDENDVCTGEESNDGSWEAGKRTARPGLIMPGTFLLGAKYFQEIAEQDDAVDRGQNVKMGLTVKTEAGKFKDCVKVIDTNPAEDVCDIEGEDADTKIYCPGIGIVQDEDLVLTSYGFVDD